MPGAIVRAYHEAETGRGPALVIVPMDDWSAPAPEPHEILGPERLVRSAAADARGGGRAGGVFDGAERPAIIAGAERGLAGARRAGRAAGLPGLPGAVRRRGRASRRTIRCSPGHRRRAARACARCSRPYDAVLVVGTGALRQYPYDPGPLIGQDAAGGGHADPEEAHRSPAELAVLGDPGAVCAALAAVARARGTPRRRASERPAAARRRASRCYAGHVLAALAERLPRDAILRRGDAVQPPGAARPHPRHRAAAGSSARWGCSASRCPRRSGCGWRARTARCWRSSATARSLYQIQALWSAATYGAGVLFIVLRNGGYAIMDRLAERAGAPGPWPALDADRHRRDGPRPGLRGAPHHHPRRAARRARRRARRTAPRRCCSRSPSRRTRRFDPNKSVPL